MGTNFYVIDPSENNYEGSYFPISVYEKLVHIGKRSGAGFYCYNCRITLHKEGESAVHFGRSIHQSIYNINLKVLADGNSFFTHCPLCGLESPQFGDNWPPRAWQGSEETAAKLPAKGVQYACSFGWAILPYEFWKLLDMYGDDEYCIVDEYGDKFTKKEFREDLEDLCPINLFSMIGEDFN